MSLKPALHQEIPGVSCRTLTTNQDKVLGLAAFAMVIIVGAVRASRILHDLAAWYFRVFIYIYFLKHVQCQLTGMAITSNPTLKSKAAEFAFPG